MKNIYLFSILILLNFLANGQEVQHPIALYSTTRDFLENKPMETEAFAEVERLSPGHLRIKKFVDKNGKKIKQSMISFAIRYEGESYFNLFYSIDLTNITYYARFDIIGRYCAIFIDDNTPSGIQNGGASYSMGTAGVLGRNSAKWGRAWLDEDGNKKQILFIDTVEYLPADGTRNAGSMGYYLSKKQLTEILSAHNIDIQDRKAKELSFEEVIQFINEMNVLDKV